MFCLTLDDFNIGNEASVSRVVCDSHEATSRKRCGFGWDTRTSWGKEASPFKIRHADVSATVSPLESCDDVEPHSTGYGEFARARPCGAMLKRTLIRDSAEGIPARVVAPRHVGVEQG